MQVQQSFGAFLVDPQSDLTTVDRLIWPSDAYGVDLALFGVEMIPSAGPRQAMAIIIESA